MKKNVTRKLSHNVLLETLENRSLLSAISLNQGVLILEGDSGSANKLSISVDPAGQTLTATANDVTRTFRLADVQMARAIGGENNDLVDIAEGFTRPAYIRTGAGDDTIYGGGDNDTVVSGNGNDNVWGRGGDDYVVDGAGDDHVDAGAWDDAKSIASTANGYVCTITSFTLIDAETDQVITGYENITSGATINLSRLPSRRLNIRANYSIGGEYGSVLFVYDGAEISHIESTAPFALAGNSGNDYWAWTPSKGTHVLHAIPYGMKNGIGSRGTGHVVNFNVTEDPTQAVPAPVTTTPVTQPTVTPPSTTSINAVNSLTLYNADTDKPIMDLYNGAEIDFAKIGTNRLSIVANTGSGTQSVRFGLDGNAHHRTENYRPFAIAGDWSSTDLAVWTPSIGNHTVTATPFTQRYAGGAAGATVSISLTVKNSAVGTTPSSVTPVTQAPPPTTTPTTSAPSTTTVVGAPKAVISAATTSINTNQSIFVNALGSTLTSGDWIHARAEWDFGDPNSRFNNLTGFNAAHQYTTAGSYTVTLKLTNDAGKSAWASMQVNVVAASRKMIYVSNWGNDTNSGTSPNAAIKTFARAAQLVGDNTEILFERGGNFSLTSAMHIGGSNVVIGAYGNGNRPVLKYTGVMTLSANIISMGSTARNVTIQGLTFDSIGDQYAYEGMARAIVPAGTGITIRDNQFLNLADAINAAMAPKGLLVQDNQAPLGIRGYFSWAQGTDHAYLGNSCADSMYQHVIRSGGTDRMLIAHNNFTNAGTTVVKGTLNIQKGSYVWITSNTLSKGTMALGPLNGADGLGDKAARLYHVVMEQNQIQASNVQFHHGLEHVMARNNIVYKNDDAAWRIDGFANDYGRGVVDVHIISNTAINAGDRGNFIHVGGDVSGITMTNNVYSAPRLLAGPYATAAVYVVDGDLGSFRLIKDNIWPAVNAIPYTEGGINFVGWNFGSSGYRTPAEWEAFNEVQHDQFTTVYLSTTGQAWLGGITAGASLARAA